MDEKSIEKFKRNIGQGKEYKIGKDSFEFLPLTMEHFLELLQVGEEFDNVKESGKNFSKEALQSISRLLNVMIKKSYPDLDDELRDAFVAKNYFVLINALLELNLPSSEGLDDGKKAALEKLKSQFNKDES